MAVTAICKMDKKLKLLRVFTVISIGALTTAIIAVLILNPTDDDGIRCGLRKVFYIKCMTCGATRAVYYFFTLQFGKAFYYHAYFTALSPVMAYVAISFSVNVFLGKKVMPLKLKWWYLIAFAVGLTVFGIVRNFIPYVY